jgi:hypothetical protein
MITDTGAAPSLLPGPFCSAGATHITENGKVWLGMRSSEPGSVSVIHWCPEIEGLKGMWSNVRQIVNAFFNMIARDIRVNPVVAIGVSDSHNFRPQIPGAAKRKKGPNSISPTDRGDDFGDADNRRGGQPVTRRRVDGRPTHVGNPVVRRVDANGVYRKSSHIYLHRPDKGIPPLCAASFARDHGDRS